MNENLSLKQLRENLQGLTVFPEEILNWIASENLWNIWVPKAYGGLELTLTEGLQKLQSLAKIDGSLGWTVTLCSGASYFIGNLHPITAKHIFQESEQKPVFGGSGGLFGTAEKEGDFYKLSGKWKYATGGPYLTHFTVNATIHENGNEVLQDEVSPAFKSFVIPKNKVTLIDDWNTMGMKATRTCSFKVNDIILTEKDSFIYDHFYLPHPIFKINFRVFADLTLWVNYIGMAEHFEEEVRALESNFDLEILSKTLTEANVKLLQFATIIEEQIKTENKLTTAFIEQIHEVSAASVGSLSQSIIEIYPHLGIKAARENHPINQIFKDYFTATQHRNFTR